MPNRITTRDIDLVLIDVSRMLEKDLAIGVPTLYLGNATHRITNKLILNRTNVWPDGMAGMSRRDAYQALRLMRSTLAAVIDAKD